MKSAGENITIPPNEKGVEIKRFPDVEARGYPATESYLRIVYLPDKAVEIVAALKNAAQVQFKAKDIFRASQLALLGVSNSHVEKDRAKILAGKPLSPPSSRTGSAEWQSDNR